MLVQRENRGFSLLLISLLVLEIFSPFAFAQTTPAASTPLPPLPAAGTGTTPTGTAATSGTTASSAASANNPNQPLFIPGVCEINELSPDQARLFWQNTQNFRADEINSLRGSALAANRPGANAGQRDLTIVNNIYNQNQPRESDTVPLRFVMEAYGLTPEQKTQAKQLLSKQDDDFISNEQANFIGERFSKDRGAIADLFQGQLGGERRPAWEDYKIRLLNGQEIAYADLAALQPFKGVESCLLNNNHITGKVTYIASTNKNTLLAGDTAVSSEQKFKTTQRLSADQIDTHLEHEGASTLVVPERYLRYVKGIKLWMGIDMIASSVEFLYFLQGADFLKKNKAKITEKRSELNDFAPEPLAYQSVEKDPIKSQVNAFATTDYSIARTLEQRQRMFRQVDNQLAEMESGVTSRIQAHVDQAKAQALAAGRQLSTQEEQAIRQQATDALHETQQNIRSIRDDFNNLGTFNNPPQADQFEAFYNHEESKLISAADLDTRELAEIQKAKQRTRITREIQEMREDLLKNTGRFGTTDKDAEIIVKKLTIAQNRLVYRLLIGYAWMGPGRFALELAQGSTFQQLGGNRFKDNYIMIYASQPELLKEFRDATNWALSGTAFDVVSDFTDNGIPRQAYSVANLLTINSPSESEDVTSEQARFSSTSISPGAAGSGWRINTRWDGNSDAAFMEDLKTGNAKYTRMAFEFKNLDWNLALKRKTELTEYYKVINFLAPALAWKFLPGQDLGSFGINVIRIFVYDAYVQHFVNPASFTENTRCKDEEVDKWIRDYAAATTAGHAVYILSAANPWLQAKTVESVVGSKLLTGLKWSSKKLSSGIIDKALNTLDPATLLQGYAASKGFEYVSNCKDDTATILAFEPLEKKPEGRGIAQTLRSVSSNDILGKLNIGRAALGVGRRVETSSLLQFVNMQSRLDKQRGSLQFTDLYYIHMKDAEVQWINSVRTTGQPASCQRKCLDSTDRATCIDAQRGVEAIDPRTGQVTTLANPTRAANHLELDTFAATLIPNRYITALMASCGGSVFRVDNQHNLLLTAPASCAGAACMRSQLQYLTGRPVGSDLNPHLGRAREIYTTKGTVVIEDGIVRFYLDNPLPGEPAEVRSPATSAIENANSAQAAALKAAAKVDIGSDGKVKISGYIENGQTQSEYDAGELKSMFTEKGVVNYVGNSQFQIFIHVLSQVDSSLIRDVVTAPVQPNQCSDSHGAPSIKIARVTGQTGAGDQAASELNAALQKIQGCGGMYEFETKDHKYMFTTDENGNPVLRVIDKTTGQATDYKITGPLRKEGNDIVVPTDKGDFKFNVGMGENGQPTITINGPGINELLPLLAARGLGGVLLFDPRTGQWGAFNGQDLQMNPNFATRGQTLTAGNDNTVRGFPTENFLSPPRSKRASTTNPLASLPSVPQETPLLILFIALAVAGVAVVRFKASK